MGGADYGLWRLAARQFWSGFFVRKVCEFLEANSSLAAWDTNFLVGCTHFSNRQSTEAAQTFKALWGSGIGGDDVSVGGGTGDDQDPVVPQPPSSA
jgi:hypothetical protein